MCACVRACVCDIVFEGGNPRNSLPSLLPLPTRFLGEGNLTAWKSFTSHFSSATLDSFPNSRWRVHGVVSEQFDKELTLAKVAFCGPIYYC